MEEHIVDSQLSSFTKILVMSVKDPSVEKTIEKSVLKVSPVSSCVRRAKKLETVE